MTRRALIDNSVLQRLSTGPEVAWAVEDLLASGWVLCSSDVSRLEAGFSTRSAAEHVGIRDRLTHDFELLPVTPACGDLAMAMQSELFARGTGRAVGVLDLLHAATAVVHDAVVVHYDHDFELVAEVDSRLRQRWVVPRGSVS